MKKGIILGMLLLSKGYDLIVIEDGEVPMASGFAHTNYYLITLCVLIVLALAIGFVIWFMQRRKYVKRLNELTAMHGSNVKAPIMIKAIKGMIAKEESEITASMI